MSEFNPTSTLTYTDRISRAFRTDTDTPSNLAIDTLHTNLLAVSDETALASAQKVVQAFPTEQVITALNHPDDNLFSFMEHKRTLTVVQEGLELLTPGQDPSLLTLAHATNMLTSVLSRRTFDWDQAVTSMEMLDHLVLPQRSSDLFIPGSPKHEINHTFGRLQFAGDRHKIACAAVMLSAAQPDNPSYTSMARTSVALYSSPPPGQIQDALSR